MIKTCVICGKNFTPPRNVEHCKKTCSLECSIELAKRNKKRYLAAKYPMMIKVCVTCGKEFQTRSNHKINCSPECSEQYQRTLKRFCGKASTAIKTVAESVDAKPEGKNVCQCCGKYFTPAYPTEKFCSDKCRFTFFSPPLRMAIGRLFGAH